MRDDVFRDWLQRRGHQDRSIGSRISNIRRIEQFVGDLDEALENDGRTILLAKFTYSTEDERQGHPNPSPVPIDGDLRTGLATLRQAIGLYDEFRSDPHAMPDKIDHAAWVAKLTREEILAVMDDCDVEGVEGFLKRVGFSRPQQWTMRRDESQHYDSDNPALYPAKATVAAAIAKLPDGPILDARQYFNGFGEAQSRAKLRELGFEIVDKRAERAASPAASSRFGNTLDHWIALFKAAFPGFKRFDLKHPKFDAEERTSGPAAKQAALDLMQDRLPSVADAQTAADVAIEVINQSHLNRFPKQIFTGGVKHASDSCGPVLLRLLQSAALPEDVATAVQDIAPHIRKKGSTAPDMETTRSAVQSLLMFAHPQDWIDINQQRRRTSTRALFDENPPPPAAIADTAACDLRIATSVKRGLQDRGLAPRDMIDVHGFLWAALRESRDAETHIPDPSSLTADESSSMPPTNLILHGPPGTGKTYATAAEALRLCGEPVPDDRAEVMAAYDRLRAEKRIEFVTFHQSLSYEDFIEGRQPVTGGEDGGGSGFRLEPVSGIFRRIAERAESGLSVRTGDDAVSLFERQVFKMSIGRANITAEEYLFDETISEGHILLGWEDIDFSDARFSDVDEILQACREHGTREGEVTAQSGQVAMLDVFRNQMELGDIVVVTKGNGFFRAIGEVTGGYEYHQRDSRVYSHRRAVRWLWVDRDGVPASEIYDSNFTMRSIYRLDSARLDRTSVERYMNSGGDGDQVETQPFVLIIDEINRANISKVFGELITLIEPDKRLGQPNALTVRLPYSGEEFGVPANLHILGTMNTADRSIALLDTALRRRFEFREMLPEPEALREAAARCGLDLPRILTVLNERIEYLYDREHQIGHAYFIACTTREEVDAVMRHKVIPLLAEYFFEDWAKVAAVLGNAEAHEGAIEGGFMNRLPLTAPPGLDEDGDGMLRFRWSLRDGAFSYDRLTGK